jgi:hypothetical protein
MGFRWEMGKTRYERDRDRVRDIWLGMVGFGNGRIDGCSRESVFGVFFPLSFV